MTKKEKNKTVALDDFKLSTYSIHKFRIFTYSTILSYMKILLYISLGGVSYIDRSEKINKSVIFFERLN